MASSKWANNDTIKNILSALTTQNRLICELCLINGLRINDCLAIKSSDISKSKFSIKEQKTGKSKKIYINSNLQLRILKQAGSIFAFEHRLDFKRHKTRHAVYNDLVRAAKAFRVKGVSPHSLRKSYAVYHFQKSGYNINKIKDLLNHSSEAVTMIYALADKINPSF